MACTCGPGQECKPLKPGCWGYRRPSLIWLAEVIPVGESDYGIVLPNEILQRLNLSLGDDILMEFLDGSITIKKDESNV